MSPLVSLASINKLLVMQNAALRTAPRCTQDTYINICMTKHSHFPYTSTHKYKQKTQRPLYPLDKHATYFNTPRLKNRIFNNGRYTTNIPTDPHIVTRTDITQTCDIYIHLLSLGILPQRAITKYCAHLHHTLATLKRYFNASVVAPLPNSEEINSLSHIIPTQSRRQIISITTMLSL